MAKSKANRVMGMMPASERDWQAEDDVRTLMRACEIRKDPKRLKAAKALAATKLDEMKKISQEKPEKY